MNVRKSCLLASHNEESETSLSIFPLFRMAFQNEKRRYQERDLQLGGKTDIPGCSKCLSSFIKLVFAHNLTRQLKLADLFFWILTLGHWDLLTFISLNQGCWSFELWHLKILKLKIFGALDFLNLSPKNLINFLYFYP